MPGLLKNYFRKGKRLLTFGAGFFVIAGTKE